MKHFNLHSVTFAALMFCSAAIWAKSVTPASDIPAYYSSIDGLAGEQMFSQLTSITNGGYSDVGYKGLWTAYKETDTDASNNIIDMYSNCRFTYSANQCGNYKNECDCYNREHSVPKSWFGGGTSNIGSDVFHVVPTDGKVNSFRSNFSFGEVSSGESHGTCNLGSSVASIHNSKRTICAAENTNTTCGISRKVFEPADQYKGDFARGYFGIILKWNRSKTMTQDGGSEMFNSTYTKSANYGLKPYAVALLMKWHRDDPVSQKEIDRNNGIQKTQGNRNPFIDYPYLAEYIWGERSGQGVDMSHMIPSTDSRFTPGRSDGWDGYTDIETVTVEPVVTVRKYFINGQIVIERDGQKFNIMGEKIED